MQVRPEDVIAIVVKETGIAEDRLRPEVALASLEIESIDLVSVLFAVEDRYGISITNEEAAEAETLGQLIDLIAAKAAAVPEPDAA